MTEINLYPMDKYNKELVDNVYPPNWENPTPAGKYNLVVIGAGSGGLVAAVGTAGIGGKVAVIERGLIGGDCLNVGCVPSKTIIRSARVMGDLARARQYGVHVPDDVQIDFARVMERVREVRAKISYHDAASRFVDMGIDVYFGEGRFSGPDTIEVAGQTLHFSKAIIATGSSPLHIPIEGIAEADYITNETVWNMTELPPRLAVIGAGPIGSELAQSFQRLGSAVTLFDLAPNVMPREDASASAIVQDIFVKEGMQLKLGAKISHVRKDGAAKVVVFELNGQQEEASVDEILLAVGRSPNIQNLNLDAGGIDYHKKGITIDDTTRTTNHNVYAVGDVASKYQFTHVADAMARIAVRNAMFPGPKQKVSDLVIPWVTYTDPEIAHVGLYPHEAEERGIAIDTFEESVAHTHRGLADGEGDGFVKIHVKKGTDKIVGATIVASHAGEMLNEITLAMNAGIGLNKLSTTIHPYPTQAEAIKMTANAWMRTRLTPTVAKLFKWWFKHTR